MAGRLGALLACLPALAFARCDVGVLKCARCSPSALPEEGVCLSCQEGFELRSGICDTPRPPAGPEDGDDTDMIVLVTFGILVLMGIAFVADLYCRRRNEGNLEAEDTWRRAMSSRSTVIWRPSSRAKSPTLASVSGHNESKSYVVPGSFGAAALDSQESLSVSEPEPQGPPGALPSVDATMSIASPRLHPSSRPAPAPARGFQRNSVSQAGRETKTARAAPTRELGQTAALGVAARGHRRAEPLVALRELDPTTTLDVADLREPARHAEPFREQTALDVETVRKATPRAGPAGARGRAARAPSPEPRDPTPEREPTPERDPTPEREPTPEEAEPIPEPPEMLDPAESPRGATASGRGTLRDTGGGSTRGAGEAARSHAGGARPDRIQVARSGTAELDEVLESKSDWSFRVRVDTLLLSGGHWEREITINEPTREALSAAVENELFVGTEFEGRTLGEMRYKVHEDVTDDAIEATGNNELIILTDTFLYEKKECRITIKSRHRKMDGMIYDLPAVSSIRELKERLAREVGGSLIPARIRLQLGKRRVPDPTLVETLSRINSWSPIVLQAQLLEGQLQLEYVMPSKRRTKFYAFDNAFGKEVVETVAELAKLDIHGFNLYNRRKLLPEDEQVKDIRPAMGHGTLLQVRGEGGAPPRPKATIEEKNATAMSGFTEAVRMARARWSKLNTMMQLSASTMRTMRTASRSRGSILRSLASLGADL